MQHVQLDPVLGWRLQPGSAYTNTTPEYETRVTHNGQGWRDRDHAQFPTTAAFRVMVLGDSFMEGYSVNDGEIFARQLEQVAKAHGRSVEAVNLGVQGWGTTQEYLSFVQEGRRYQPQLVLLGFVFINDLVDNLPELQRKWTGGAYYYARPFLDLGTGDIRQPDYARAQRMDTAQRLVFAHSRLVQRGIIVADLMSFSFNIPTFAAVYPRCAP